MKKNIVTDEDKNHQMKKEAIASIIMYILFFFWWYFTGYGIAQKGNPQTYTYIFGLPLWFFLSCIVGYILFSAATILVVKLVFQDFDLGSDETFDNEKEAKNVSL